MNNAHKHAIDRGLDPGWVDALVAKHAPPAAYVAGDLVLEGFTVPEAQAVLDGAGPVLAAELVNLIRQTVGSGGDVHALYVNKLGRPGPHGLARVDVALAAGTVSLHDLFARWYEKTYGIALEHTLDTGPPPTCDRPLHQRVKAIIKSKGSHPAT